MRRFFPRSFSIIGLAVIFLSGRASGQNLGPAAKAENGSAAKVESGKRIYISYGCYQCHGFQGQGAGATGSRIGPDPISWPAFVRYVRQPTGQMPPYTIKVTSDSELAEIYAFLQALPRPRAARSLPLGP